MLLVRFCSGFTQLYIYDLCSDGFREEMEFDMAALNELQLAVYVFHEAVCFLLLKSRFVHSAL